MRQSNEPHAKRRTVHHTRRVLETRISGSRTEEAGIRRARTLFSQQLIRIEMEYFEDGNDYSGILTRAKFEELNTDLFRKIIKLIQ